jgi:hypothetical protein
MVPLLQNRMAYDKVEMVAAWPRMKQPPKKTRSRPYLAAFIYLRKRSAESGESDLGMYTHATWPMLLLIA